MTLLERFENQGIRLSLSPDREGIVYDAPKGTPQETYALIRQHKQALLAFLKAEAVSTNAPKTENACLLLRALLNGGQWVIPEDEKLRQAYLNADMGDQAAIAYLESYLDRPVIKNWLGKLVRHIPKHLHPLYVRFQQGEFNGYKLSGDLPNCDDLSKLLRDTFLELHKPNGSATYIAVLYCLEEIARGLKPEYMGKNITSWTVIAA
jgi:hypothetical protein